MKNILNVCLDEKVGRLNICLDEKIGREGERIRKNLKTIFDLSKM